MNKVSLKMPCKKTPEVAWLTYLLQKCNFCNAVLGTLRNGHSHRCWTFTANRNQIYESVHQDPLFFHSMTRNMAKENAGTLLQDKAFSVLWTMVFLMLYDKTIFFANLNWKTSSPSDLTSQWFYIFSYSSRQGTATNMPFWQKPSHICYVLWALNASICPHLNTPYYTCGSTVCGGVS